MTIQCIAFDLDDTLWECHPVIMRAEQHFYDWLKLYYPKISQKYSFEALIEHRTAFMQAHPETRHDMTALRKNWLKRLAQEADYENSAKNLVESGFEVFWLARNQVTFFEGTLERLEALSKHYKLGVISNGNADVKHIGIGHLFDFVLSSEKAGVAKPHKDIFNQAVELAAVNPEEMIYVGDDPERDVLGALSAGLHAVWYNPRLQPWPGGQTPTAVIQHLNELDEIIIKIQKKGGGGY